MVSPSHTFVYNKEILLHPNYETYINSHYNHIDLIRHSLGNFYRYNTNWMNYPDLNVTTRFNPTTFTLKTVYTFPDSRYKRLFSGLTDQQVQNTIHERIIQFLDNYIPEPDQTKTQILVRVVQGVPVYVSPTRRQIVKKTPTGDYIHFPWKYPDRMKDDPFIGVRNK
jgi:hypothetical protein